MLAEILEQVNWGIIATVLGPISAILAVFISDRRSKQNTTATVTVQGQEAKTHEFVAITQGFSELREQLEEDRRSLREDVQRLEEDRGTLREDVKTLTDRMEVVEEDNRLLLAENTAIMEHLTIVEALVPNPPGAPPRPAILKQRNHHG